MAKSEFPSIFYLYANRTYKEELEAYLLQHFSTVSNLNVSNATGIGYKIECFDVGDLKTLDVELEKYEGWIQQTRRNDFADIDTEFFDLDKFISGCNKRITFEPLIGSVWNKIQVEWRVNANRKTVAVRNLNVTSAGATDGSYEIRLGKDKITGGVPLGATIDINRVYRKNLNGEEFRLITTDAYLTGFVIEFKVDEFRNGITAYTTLDTTDLDHMQDDDYTTRYSPVLNGGGSSGCHDYFEIRINQGEIYKEPAFPYTKLNMIISFQDDNFTGARYNVLTSVYTVLKTESSFLYNTEVYHENHLTKTAAITGADSYISIDLTQPFNRFTVLFWLPNAAYVGHTTLHIWEMFLS